LAIPKQIAVALVAVEEEIAYALTGSDTSIHSQLQHADNFGRQK
jgi:hypothetical protein